MNPLDPKGLLDRLLMICVGLLTCVVALTVTLYLLARIWYWLLILTAIGFGIYLLVQWLRNRSQRW